MTTILRAFFDDQDGMTAMEYSLIGVVAVLPLLALASVGAEMAVSLGPDGLAGALARTAGAGSQ